MQLFKKSRQTLQKSAVGLYAILLTSPVFADLPKVEDPTRGKGKGFLETMQNYAYDIAIFVSLLISTIALFVVASTAISKYREVTASGGKVGWGDFTIQIVIGVLLIVAVIWLVSRAVTIL